jgi:hypothetical protein
MNTTYDYATGLGPLASNNLEGGRKPTLTDSGAPSVAVSVDRDSGGSPRCGGWRESEFHGPPVTTIPIWKITGVGGRIVQPLARQRRQSKDKVVIIFTYLYCPVVSPYTECSGQHME